MAARNNRKVEPERVGFLATMTEFSEKWRIAQVEPGRTAGQLRVNYP